MQKFYKLLALWFVMGMIYFVIEGIWRIPQGGYANIVMLPIGGLCGVFVGGINQIPAFYKMKIVCQSIIGACIVLTVEFVTGYILNIWLGLGIWDYSGMPFNIAGQVCMLFAVFWFLLMPFAIWIEDALRFKLWGEGKYYSLISIYIDLLILK